MSILKRLFTRHVGGREASTGSNRSVSQLLNSNESNGFHGSYFEDDFSPSALGTDNETRSRDGRTAAVHPKNNIAPASPAQVISRPPPQLRVPSASPRRTPSPAAHVTPCSVELTSIGMLEDKLRKLSEARLGSTTLMSGRNSTRGASQQSDKMDVELRHLEAKTRRTVTKELDANRGWQALAAEIKHPDRQPEEPLFDDNRIRLLSGNTGVSPTDEIVKTWSTTGRNRPTIRDLYNLLMDIKQVRIASQLARGLGVTEDDIHQASLVCELTDDMIIDAANLQPYLDGVYQLCFDSVAQATDNFSMNSVNKVGEGNFGDVYRVMIDGQEMAVKRFKNHEEGELFFREIKTLAKLNHPNLLSLCGVVDQGDQRCIITRYMRNGNLQHKLRREVLPWWLRLRVLRDVAAALEHMHSLRPAIIHRDVKPANILLDDDMNALLGDFGLSREKKSFDTSITHICPGTPDYMPLEVLRGDVTVKSDMYSFGVVVLEILTGQRVFDAMRDHVHITDYVDNLDAQQAVDQRLPHPPTVVTEGLFNLGIRCKDTNRNIRPEASMARVSLQQYFEHVAEMDRLDNP